MGGDIYFSCDSDKKKKQLKGKTCITAVTVMELVSDISTTFGQKRMSPGSHLTKFCNWQIFFFLQDITETNLTFFKQLPIQQLSTSKQPLG